MQLAMWKLGKKTPQPWWLLSPIGRHGAPPPGTAAYINQPTCCATSLSLKQENIIVFTIYYSTCVRHNAH
jgi:hypothetical protein